MKKLLLFTSAILFAILNHAQTIHVENFETGNAERTRGTSVLPYVTLSTSNCGELKIEDNDELDFFPEAFKPYVITFRNPNGASKLLDVSSNTKIIMGVRAQLGTQLRAAFTSLKNGAPTTPKYRDQVKKVVAKDYELEELVFDFSGETSTTGAFDVTQVEHVFLEVNPISGEFGVPGGVFFIDYLVVGDKDASVNETTCTGLENSFGDGSSFSLIDFETDGVQGIGGERIDQVILTNDYQNGFVTIKDNPVDLLGESESLLVSSRDINGDLTTIDMTGNVKVIIRAKPYGGDAKIRVDLRSVTGDNTTNGVGARVTRSFPEGLWTEAEFIFHPDQLKDIDGNEVDITDIDGFNMMFNQETGGIGADSIVFDFISFGEAIPRDVVGLNVQRNSMLNFFPNPVSDVLSLESPFNGTLNIMNQLGEVVKTEEISSNTSSVSTSSLESGMYIIQVSTVEGNVFTNTFSKD